MPINIDGTEYYENENITYDEFMDKLKSGSKVFTSQTSTVAVMELWDKALQQADYVIHVPMDSALSGSYNTARSIAEEYNGKVRVVDVKRVSLPTLQAIYDIRNLIEKGLTVDEIVQITNENSDNYSCYVVLDELEHLKQGGRISSVVAKLGEIFSIKPIIEFDKGKLHVRGKSHGILKGEKNIIAAIKQDLKEKFKDKKVNFHIAYSCSIEEANKFKERACKELELDNIVTAALPASLTCHIGAGARGIAVEEVLE